MSDEHKPQTDEQPEKEQPNTEQPADEHTPSEEPPKNEAPEQEPKTKDEAKEQANDAETRAEELLEEAVAEAQPELSPEEESWKVQYLRLAAEFDNFKKRTTREKQQLVRFANEGLLKKILPIADDMSRALTAAEQSDNKDALKEGIQLIHKKLKTTLHDQGLQEIPALGQKFDDSLHEAIASMPVEDEDKKGTVIEEVEKGYLYNGKVLRYAKVITAQ